MNVCSLIYNICIWLITDQRLAKEDKLVKLEPIKNNAIAPMAAWLLMLNATAVSDGSASDTFKVQEPEFRLYPELQLEHTAELVTEHIRQLLAVHLLIVRLITFWTDSDIPETVEVM